MNLLPARLAGGRLALADGTMLPCPRNGAGEVWCGVRPEDFRWVPPDSAPNGASLTGAALTVEPLGPDTLVTMQGAGAEIACRLPPRSVRRAGERVTLALDPARLHLFGRADGRRL